MKKKKTLLLLPQIYQYIPATITEHQQICLRFIVRIQLKMNEEKKMAHNFLLPSSQSANIDDFFYRNIRPFIYRATINIGCDLIDFIQTNAFGLCDNC